MKLELKPGVSPAYFWTFIGLGAASTAAGALALTTYAWAGVAGALIALIIGFVQGRVKPPPGGVQLLLSMLAVLSLSSCAGVAAFLASSAGQATVSLVDLGLNVAAAKGKIATGDNVAIQRGLAIVTNPALPNEVKVFSLAELGLSTAVSKGLIKQGDALLIQEAGVIIKSAVITPQVPEAKQPVSVKPLAAFQNRLKPELHNEDRPGCMQLAERIPLYGERVAFMLSTVNVTN